MKPISIAEKGGFDAEGSWHDAWEPNQRRGFVTSLASRVSFDKLTPVQAADDIERAGEGRMFPSLWQWRHLPEWAHWRYAWTRTSAESCVKYGGRGAHRPAWDNAVETRRIDVKAILAEIPEWNPGAQRAYALPRNPQPDTPAPASPA